MTISSSALLEKFIVKDSEKLSIYGKPLGLIQILSPDTSRFADVKHCFDLLTVETKDYKQSFRACAGLRLCREKIMMLTMQDVMHTEKYFGSAQFHGIELVRSKDVLIADSLAESLHDHRLQVQGQLAVYFLSRSSNGFKNELRLWSSGNM
ncbi:hypothetical protein Tco_0617776 [Tanacetum coccineum]